jgi:Domain of unknown function (DUF4942)
MDSLQFYPTPGNVIDKMLALGEVDELIKASKAPVYLLEPSAGTGEILVKVNGKYFDKVKYHFCEIDQQRSDLCAKKNYNGKFRFLGYDFLEYSGTYQFDMILMNPPFADGASHLLKAIEISSKTRIVCLLNAETIRNPFTPERKHLGEILHKHGAQIVYLDGAFSDAERKTDVDVAMVRLDIDKGAVPVTRFDSMAQNGADDITAEIPEMSELEKADYIDALCRSYQKAFDCTRMLWEAYQQMKLFAGPFTNHSDLSKMMEHLFRSTSYAEFNNGYAEQLQMSAWNTVFAKTRLNDYATKSVKDDFAKWAKDQGRVDLNRENVLMLFNSVFGSLGEIKKRSIREGLDVLMRANPDNFDGKNRWEYKTNSQYMVTKKSILNQCYIDYSGHFGVGRQHHSNNSMYDLDRALCFLTGKTYSDVKGFEYLFGAYWSPDLSADQIEARKTGKFETEFFTGICYLKGSVHLTFKDVKLMEACNRFLADGSLPAPEYFAGKNRRDKQNI